MNPRITSIENLIASDPGGRGVFALMLTDQLRLAAQSLRLARRVAIVSGFYIPEAAAGETDGPPGAKILGTALRHIGIAVDYVTDRCNAPLFRALGIDPLVEPSSDDLDGNSLTHLVAVERPGRAADGRYRNMHGVDITDVTAPLDELFLRASQWGQTTIGIGDGGNEIGMGRVFAETLAAIPNGPKIATTVATDFCIAAGVSNWGALGLVGALSVLAGEDLLPAPDQLIEDFERLVSEGGAVDGITHRREPTCDGVDMAATVRMLESIRGHIKPSPLERGEPLLIGILGYGETGKAAAALARHCGHRVCISDAGAVTLEPGLIVSGVESGGHTVEFLEPCDLVCVSPGVPADSPILIDLHHRGIPVMSELELAFQLGAERHARYPLVAVTGTIGKRTTVELLQRLFVHCSRPLTIGGNRGTPLSALLLSHDPSFAAHGHQAAGPPSSLPLALAVSSFQLESVVHFRPHIAVILNIHEDHLDRHESIVEYLRIKSRIFMNHGPDDVLILPYDDPRLRVLARKHAGRTFFVSARQMVDRGAWIENSTIHLNIDGAIEGAGSVDYPFGENLLSAVLIARLHGLTTDQIAAALPAAITSPSTSLT